MDNNMTLTLTLINPNPSPNSNPDPNHNPETLSGPNPYVILSPIYDWLIYVYCVPSILGTKYWHPGHMFAITSSINYPGTMRWQHY